MVISHALSMSFLYVCGRPGKWRTFYEEHAKPLDEDIWEIQDLNTNVLGV